MQLHQLKPIRKGSSRRRVGRGGKKGTYSGRGVKGQKSRAGKKPRPGFVGGDTPLSKRLPKQRGQVGKLKKVKQGRKIFRLKQQNKPVALNFKEINKNFKANETVSPKTLLEKGLIDRIKGRIPRIKILSEGELKRKLEFKGVELSKSAQEKIKKSVSKKSISEKSIKK
jgi:large subunit ribosomal protein L15